PPPRSQTQRRSTRRTPHPTCPFADNLLPPITVAQRARGLKHTAIRPWGCPRLGSPATSSTMNPVLHFEMPYADRGGMAKFYGSAFGWQTQMLGEEMGNYVVVTTTETDEAGPKAPGRINGGFFPRRPDWPAQHPSVVIAVDDIGEAMRRVADAGGQVLGEP